MITVEISPGELIDRWTILRVKKERLGDNSQVEKVIAELAKLDSQINSLAIRPKIQELSHRLFEANLRMWDSMQAVYDWRESVDSSDYVQLVVAIIEQNKERAIAKREIDLVLQSSIVEAKSFFSGTESSETK